MRQYIYIYINLLQQIMENFTCKIGLFLIFVELIQGFGLHNGLGNIGCRGRALDLAFALDASDAISDLHFQKQVNIIKHVVNSMDIGMKDDQVRIGAISFGDRTRVNFHFSKSRDLQMVGSKIDRMKKLGGKSNLANVLKLMCGAMFRRRRGSRSGVKHMAIVVTDGSPHTETDTQLAAQACRDSGVEIFVIGVGREISDNGLRTIVSQPVATHFLHFGKFDDLHRIRDYLIQRTCQSVLASDLNVVRNELSPQRRKSLNSSKETHMDEKACHNKVADVFFLLDSSSSIRKEDFKKQINVVEGIIRRFDISPTLTRVGISTFSHEYHNLLKFGDSNNKADVIRRLGTIKYLSGGTRTGHALHRLRTKVFNARSIRSGADRIIVVFTDGQSGDYRRTTLESKQIKKSGVKIFVVGIGSYVDQEELEDMASEPTDEFLYTFDSFDTLLEKSGLLREKTCEGISNLLINDQDVCNSSQPTDVMFMVSHNHLGQKKTNSVMKMVAEVVEIFGTEGPFRVGTMFDECLVNQDIPIGSIRNKTKLLNKIDAFQYGTPKSMIQQLRFDVFSHKKRSTRRRARRLGLLFLDSDIKLNDPSIRIESRRALNRGIHLYAVVIGKGVDVEQVERSIAPRERIIFVPSYETLLTSLPSILVNRLCLRRDNSLTYNGLSH